MESSTLKLFIGFFNVVFLLNKLRSKRLQGFNKNLQTMYNIKLIIND
jgi:hypothetical protein